MLINALHPEETRVAVLEDDRLLELEVERPESAQQKGNIYKAAITRVEPSLQAAFLDIGSNRNGFLQIHDINHTYFQNYYPNGNSRGRPAIQDVLRAGQDLVVQVVKDERDAKGATLTTNLSIPGRFLVLMIGSQRGGVSRKISDEGQRYKLKQAISKLRIPCGMGVIVRTAGINKSSQELQRDLDGLLEIWYEVIEKAAEPGSPKVLYKESDLAVRTIRDYLTNDIDEILIDHEPTFERTTQFIKTVMPAFISRVQLYTSPKPLFSQYHVENQVEATNYPEITLPSGGSVVINVTEAVVTIDVNSGRSTGNADVEETAFRTNIEAAREVIKQLRLRDLGGLIVIDFIDMLDKRHKQSVEKALKDSSREDKAKIEIGRISKFGLLEMSRQRLKSSLVSQSHMICPHCSGRGRVRTPESAALEVLRKIQTAVTAGGVNRVKVRMSPGAALLLLNSKRQYLSQLEQQTGTTIIVFADGRLRPDEAELEIETGRAEGVMTISTGPQVAPPPPQRRPAPSRQEPRVRDEERGEDEDGEEGEDNQRGNRADSDDYRQGGGRGRGRRRSGRGRGRGGRDRERGRSGYQGQSGDRDRPDNRRSEDRQADDRRADERRPEERGPDERRGDDRGPENTERDSDQRPRREERYSGPDESIPVEVVSFHSGDE
jgi:ribonuclease E